MLADARAEGEGKLDATCVGIDTVLDMGADGVGGLGAGQDDASVESGCDPTVQQLRSFLVLAEELHFGHAARRMFTSQPAFSRQIRALERRLRVGLVVRSTRRVELTAAGQALVAQAKAVVEGMDGVHRVARVHARELRGRLTLGSIGAEAAMPYTQAILTELRERHPKIVVEIRSLDFVEQAEALAHGEVDAAFLRPPVPAGFQTLHLATEPRVLCLPADDPLVARQPLTLADLGDQVFIDVPAGAHREWWDYWTINPRPDGTPVRYGTVVSDIEPMLLAVARRQGIVFLPAAARDLYPRPGIAYLDVIDLPPSTAALVWPASHRSRPVLVALRQAAQTTLRRNQPSTR